MAKYIIDKVALPNGMGDVEMMLDGMKDIKADHPAEKII